MRLNLALGTLAGANLLLSLLAQTCFSLAAPLWVSWLLLPGFSPAARDLTVDLMRIQLIGMISTASLQVLWAALPRPQPLHLGGAGSGSRLGAARHPWSRDDGSPGSGFGPCWPGRRTTRPTPWWLRQGRRDGLASMAGGHRGARSSNSLDRQGLRRLEEECREALIGKMRRRTWFNCGAVARGQKASGRGRGLKPREASVSSPTCWLRGKASNSSPRGSNLAVSTSCPPSPGRSAAWPAARPSFSRRSPSRLSPSPGARPCSC